MGDEFTDSIRIPYLRTRAENGMIKQCKECGKDYQSPAQQRKRKGTCRNCINRILRSHYAAKKAADGKVVFAFKNLMEQGLKRCPMCDTIKPLNDFTYRQGTKYRTQCRPCESLRYKKYEIANKDKINAARRRRRADPIRGIIFAQRDRQRSLFKRTGKKKHRSQTNQIREWLGCSVEECVIYLESLFLPGMYWENRGTCFGFWQIDHIIPVSLSEISDNGELLDTELNRKIWHYTNLQPLWFLDNLIKSNKYERQDIHPPRSVTTSVST